VKVWIGNKVKLCVAWRIISCTQNNDCLMHVVMTARYTVKVLLQHDFFLEDTGIKVELASKDEAKDLSRDVIQLWLRVVDPKRRKHQHKEDEAIQFDYNIKKDSADKVAQEMVCAVHCFS